MKQDRYHSARSDKDLRLTLLELLRRRINSLPDVRHRLRAKLMSKLENGYRIVAIAQYFPSVISAVTSRLLDQRSVE